MRDRPPGSDRIEFKQRARLEADRYGASPAIFVRELAQNARDAGARRLSFATHAADGMESISCRDDGAGMSLEHAQRYLFRLYASSKGRGDAGRFGVGFWSVLRFLPATIVVRSWPRAAAAWEIELQGDLALAWQRVPARDSGSGTEIVLRRRTSPEGLGWLRPAVEREARFLRCKSQPERPLEVAVDGVPVNAAFDLPAPRLAFRHRGLRGVVSLSATPGVTLFANGLRVREAVVLDDLLSGPAPGTPAPALGALGLAPQMLLDADGLDLLLARGDARDDRTLRRLLARAERELGRLVSAQLSASHPLAWWRRASTSFVLIAAVLLALAGVAWAYRPAPVPAAQPSVGVAAPAVIPAGAAGHQATTTAAPAARPVLLPYRDLGTSYTGPQADGLPTASAVALRYAPTHPGRLLAALRIGDLDTTGAPLRRAGAQPAAGQACSTDCVTLTLEFADGPGWLRLPVPTGHVVDPTTLRVLGRPAALYESAEGEPMVALPEAAHGALEYRTGPARLSSVLPLARAHALPSGLAARVARLPAATDEHGVAAAAEVVRSLVRHSSAPDVVAAHRAATARGVGFLERSLQIGAGDCDLQNGVLLRVLQAQRIPARLAIGFVGREGVAAPTLHAWIEYHDGGVWRIADASHGDSSSPPVAPPGSATGARSAAVLASAGASAGGSLRTSAPGAAIATLTALALALAWRGRTRRVLQLDPATDVTQLLLGAMRRPDAFRTAPAVFHHPLLPTLGGGRVTLAHAWTRASERRLYSARAAASPLAAAALQAGLLVLDASQAEAAAVGAALGATDLDQWQAMLQRRLGVPLVDALNQHLSEAHEDWQVCAIADGPPEPAVLELPLRREPARRVVVNLATPWLAAAIADHAQRPARAVFCACERLTGALQVPAARRGRLLAPLAQRALIEAAA